MAGKILNNLHCTHEMLVQSYSTARNLPQSFFFSPTDPVEIRTIVLSLKNDSSPGFDNFPVALHKKALPSLIIPLIHIFNISLENGVFPNCWKLAIVSPIYKGGQKQSPDSYRPIALLSVLAKVLEKLVHRRLVSFVEKYRLLSDNQFGFRQGKSTEDAVSNFIDLVSSHVDNGECCIGVFLDLAKAFDTVSVGLLLRKLEAMGIRGIPLKWFESYLTNRKQCIKLDNIHLSSELPIEFGVPQGSILGPTLFLLHINDIVNLKIPNSDIIAYADDTNDSFLWTELGAGVESHRGGNV